MLEEGEKLKNKQTRTQRNTIP